jgi:hypothetical protein
LAVGRASVVGYDLLICRSAQKTSEFCGKGSFTLEKCSGQEVSVGYFSHNKTSLKLSCV